MGNAAIISAAVRVLLGLAIGLLPLAQAAADAWKAPANIEGPKFDHWRVVNQDISDAYFPNDVTGYLVTRSGDILKTENRGKDWLPKGNVPYGLRGITFVDPKTGWAIGGNGHIIHTKDGGESWQSQKSGSKNTLSAIVFRDARTGWSVGDAGTILRTGDGGKGWSAVPLGSQVPLKKDARLQALSFFDGDHGWAAGSEGTVLYTDDGGGNWSDRSVPERVELFAASFVSRTRGVVAGMAGRLFYTDDGGRNWTAITLNSEVRLLAAQFEGTDKVWVAGEAGYLFEVMFQSDGKVSWNTAPTGTLATLRKVLTTTTEVRAFGDNGVILAREPSGSWSIRAGRESGRSDYNAIAWKSEREGWIATADGITLRSQDRGLTWTAVAMPWPEHIPGRSRTLLAAAFHKERGWMVGEGGVIFSTSDGGATWSQQPSPTTGALLSIAAVSDQAAVAVGANGALIRTTDGARWAAVPVDEPGELTSVWFVDEKHGWVAGNGGVILFSEDGGASWKRQNRSSAVQLRSVFMRDAKHGWAVGSRGTVLYTEDGANWASIGATPLRSNFLGVRFVSPTLGWAVDDRGSIFVSTDGGKKWERRAVVPQGRLKSLYVQGESFGWAVGRNLVARLEWKEMPPLVEFDAVNRNDSVRIYGKVKPGPSQLTVRRLEVKTAKESRFRDIPAFNPIEVDDNGEFRFQWNPGDSGISGETIFNYQVTLGDGVYEYPQTVGAGFVYKSWLGKFEEDHPFLIWVCVLAVLALWLLLIPRVLFAVYGTLPWKAASELLGGYWAGKLGVALASLLVLPYYFRFPWMVRAWAARYAAGKAKLTDLAPDLRADYVKRPLILDAWVSRHRASARKYYDNVLDQVSRNNIYVPMPVSLDGTRLVAPAKDEFAWLAGPQSEHVVITGAGGSGKSTFAARLGSWALDGWPGKGAMIPAFIRDSTTDLQASVREILRPIVNYDPDLDDELLSALIQHKRVIVIVDSLSEWGETERKYMEGIQGKLAIGALLITSRRPLALLGARQIFVHGLDSASMIAFRQQYVGTLKVPLSREVERILDTGLIDMKARWFENSEPTCLLVRMYIDDVIANALQTPDHLPGTAADIIIRYVQRLTASEETDLVLRVAKLSASEMLSEEYLPQWIDRSTLLKKLATAFKDEPVQDALTKLVNAGIIETTSRAGTATLQFVHDPVAEFLAGIHYCEQLKSLGEPAWGEFAAKLAKVAASAPGFISAMETCLASYRISLKLPAYMRLKP
jgi:photosystem II stability/assembly factor-like uncharacterized protein